MPHITLNEADLSVHADKREGKRHPSVDPPLKRTTPVFRNSIDAEAFDWWHSTLSPSYNRHEIPCNFFFPEISRHDFHVKLSSRFPMQVVFIVLLSWAAAQENAIDESVDLTVQPRTSGGIKAHRTSRIGYGLYGGNFG